MGEKYSSIVQSADTSSREKNKWACWFIQGILFLEVFHKTAIRSPVQAVEVVCPTSIDNGSMRLAEVAEKYAVA